MELVTYAGTQAEIDVAVRAGADHLILEDSKLSVRCYCDDYSTPGFDKYVQLAAYARSLKSDLRLSANIDKLMHDRHRPLLVAAAQSLKAAAIDCVRVQDPGVAVLLAEYGYFRFHLNTETGNNNANGVAYYADNAQVRFERQVLSNDWTADAIAAVKRNIQSQIEFQVHGPVLLQYTDRRLMAGYEVHQQRACGSADELAPISQRLADVEGRAYPLFDNPHGHFMYASFDKALYKHIPRLLECELDAWLIDARGESLAYLETSLRLYREAAKSNSVEDAAYEQLCQVARRSYKPGFFIANNTDYVFEADAQSHAERQVVARVIDSVKQASQVLECLEPLTFGDYQVHTPEGKCKKITIKSMRNMSDEDITCSTAGQLVKVRWTKGIYADCELVRLEN